MSKSVSNAISRSAFPIALYLLAAAYLSLGLESYMNVYDEGVKVVGGARILAGEMPVRDFWTVYAPGYFYFYAAVLKVFGATLIATRWANVFVLALLPTLAAMLLLRRTGIRWAFLGWLLVLGSCTYLDPAVVGSPAPVLVLAAATAFAGHLENGCRRRLVVAGVATGLAAITKHDYGFYVALPQFLFLLAGAIRPNAEDKQSGARTLAIWAGATALGAAPILPFVAAVPPDVLWRDLVTTPATSFAAYRGLPYPRLFHPLSELRDHTVSLYMFLYDFLRQLRFYLPFLVGVLAIVQLYRTRAKRDAGFRVLGFLTLLAVCLYNVARVRATYYQQTPAFTATLLVLVLIAAAWTRRAPGGAESARTRWARWTVTAGVLALVVPLALIPARDRFGAWSSGRAFQRSQLPAADGLKLGDEDLEDAIGAVRRLVPPGGRFFSGNTRHDLLFVNNVLAYFLAERGCGGYYHELHTGVVTTEAVQRRIVSDLERNRVDVALLWDAPAPAEPNQSSVSSGVTVLDDYLRAAFAPVEMYGPYRVLVRRVPGAPEAPPAPNP